MQLVHPTPQAETDTRHSSSLTSPQPRGQSLNLCKCPSPKVSVLGLTYGSTTRMRPTLSTVWCLEGRAHCAAPPNQKRPRKSNPAETTPPAQLPLRTNPEKKIPSISPIGKIRTISNGQSEFQMRFKLANTRAKRRSRGGCFWVKLRD